MNAPWKLICIVFALVLFFIGIWFNPGPGAPAPWYTRPSLISAGLFFYMLSILV
jgi:hypothetical protein